MPYIKQDERPTLYTGVSDLIKHVKTSGQLNYVITVLCQKFLEKTDKKYEDYNKIMGVLECAKQEFYRRAVVPYEEEKIKLNGDVYK